MQYNRIIPYNKTLSKCKFCKNTKPYIRMCSSQISETDINTFVECGTCGARGPLVYVANKIPTEDITKKTIQEAAKLWNK